METDSSAKLKTGGKMLNKHASVEPIFPPELRKYQPKPLTLPGDKATWHRLVNSTQKSPSTFLPHMHAAAAMSVS